MKIEPAIFWRVFYKPVMVYFFIVFVLVVEIYFVRSVD